MRGDDFGYLYRHNGSLVFRRYKFPEVRGSVCSEPRCATGGTDQRLAAFETEEAIMRALLGYGIDKIRIDESADGRTLSQSVSGRFVECSRH